ncbi:MAG: DUF6673 family protein [Ruminococcus sp.]
MNKPVWKYGENIFPFDIDEYEDSVKYKSAVGILVAAKLPERMSEPDGFIKAYCGAISAFFDNIFGEGTSEILFGENNNKRICDDAYYSFLEFIAEQVQRSDARMLEAIKKYAPKKDVRT